MFEEIIQQGGTRKRRFAKGDVIQRPGDPVSRGYFVSSGCLRSYVIDAEGKEHVLQFAPEQWVIGDQRAAMRKTPATLFIDALEETEAIELDFDLIDQAAEHRPELIKSVLNKVRMNVVALNERIVDLMAATGEERYLRFIATYPGLAQRLPQKLIASYLGLTPESLSRIRKSIARGGSGRWSGVR